MHSVQNRINRKIFFVVASGGHDTDRHYYDTIKNKRTIEEASRFLSSQEISEIDNSFHGQGFSAWGAVPGKGNLRTWEAMEPGDYVLIYRNGRIILVAEVALKVRNPELAKLYWREDRTGRTWEYIYFLINEVSINVKQADFNRLIGYRESYFPRGFTCIETEKTQRLLLKYGDLISLLLKMQSGQKPEEVDLERRRMIDDFLEQKVERAPTEHDEMQWRLIRLGTAAHFDVWVPTADQGRSYDGHDFRQYVIPEFREAVDIPSYIKNIDTVWKLGLSIKAAFEIEHSTQIYSGILRLSDLKALAPNSWYPLFIVADRDKKNRVFDQLKRPTFANNYLQLDRTVKFLAYDRLRKLDETIKEEQLAGFNIDWLTGYAESPS